MQRLGVSGTRTRLVEARRCGTEHDRVISALTTRGLALMDDLPTREDLLLLARSIATVVPHRDSDLDGVTTLIDLGEPTPRTGLAGFSAAELAPHTDCSGSTAPPALLMMSCSTSAVSGGQAVLVDGQAVHDDLAESDPDALHAFMGPRSALFGGASGHLGSIITTIRRERLLLRLRQDELARFSPEVSWWLPVLRAAIERHAIEIELAAGQGYLLDNHRWLHGRKAFTGHRVVHRVHGDPLPDLGIITGLRCPAPSGAE
ncbi:TauD/TfdA family dioxygenase [Umezawaea sp. NPDC059074]|uniref:TauD/TfdA family dioxygenase n=1 Tax=Umezawaea sp. NPDC059074 TaxID=3346716 RepID=UPI003684CDA8